MRAGNTLTELHSGLNMAARRWHAVASLSTFPVPVRLHLLIVLWDYSGTTASFNEGRLDTLWRSDEGLGASVLLRLDPGGQGLDSLTARVMGDRLYPSTDPAMQQLNPRVYQMLVRPR